MANRDERHSQRIDLERTAHKASTTEALDELRATLQNPAQIDPTELSAQIEKVQYFAEQVTVLDSQVLDLLLETDQDMAPEINSRAEFRRAIVGVVKSAEAKLAELRAAANPDSASNSFASVRTGAPHSARAKLPKLELPSFSGDPIQWQCFWDSFESKVDSDPTVSEVDKLHYLLKLLEDEAAEAVQGYRPIAKNYAVVVGVLKEHFGRPETAKFKHFEALFTLPSAEFEPSRLKEIYLECEKHIRCLVALGLAEDTFGQVFVPLILSKLPKNTRLQLHRSNGQTDWTLANLRDLMKNEILARDLSDRFSKDLGASKKAPPKPGPDSKAGPSGHVRGATGGGNVGPRLKGKPWATQGSLMTHGSSAQQPRCAFCGGSHYPDACTKYPTVDARRSVLNDRYFKCLTPGHRVSQCTSSKSCYFCNASDHHRSVCYRNNPLSGSGGGNGRKGGIPPPKGGNSGHSFESSLPAPGQDAPGSHTVLKMASVIFPAANETVRMYLDDGSSASYVTTATAKRLKLKLSEPKFCSVGRFGSAKRDSKQFRTADLAIPLKDGKSFTITVHVADVITTRVQKLPLDPKKFPALSYLPLADSLCQRAELVEIDALIGGDYLHKLFTGERIAVDDGLFLYGSKLGYIAAGTVEAEPVDSSELTTVCLDAQLFEQPKENARLERLWALEDLGVKDDPYVSDNDTAQASFDRTLVKKGNRVEVGLPYRDQTADLPDNFGLALGRLKSLQQRSDTETLEQYDKIIVDPVAAGIVERVDTQKPAERVHYIPHHCVVKPGSATTKIRVVYDASAKASKKSPSLNDLLLRGPVRIQDLCGFLLRFRLSKIALISDIEKAFHQIGIRPEDRDVMRFLWLKRPWLPPTKHNLVTLRFCRVPFGMVCSPFLLDATLLAHLSQKGTSVALDIQRNIYVDNFQGGSADVSTALSYFREAKDCFADISMNAREWYSNSSEFLSAIPAEDRGASADPKVLGIPWDTNSDVLSCPGPQMKPGDSECRTKREFLSAVSSVFDPCGWISPALVSAKLCLQDMWKQSIGWDTVVPTAMADQIDSFLEDMKEIVSIRFSRWLNRHISDPKAVHELHCFVDASGKAYAAVVYVKSTAPSGKCSVGLAFAKVRLAPVKRMTIPRLELMAAWIGVRVLAFVESELKPSLSFAHKYVWSDSKCVLFWLQSKKDLKVFVQNRVSYIKKAEGVPFRYVPTAYNPADIPSRGMAAKELLNCELWWSGPKFLLLGSSMWPENIPVVDEPPEAVPELSRKSQLTALVQDTVEITGIASIIDINSFSKWRRLVWVTAYVLLAVERFQNRRTRSDRTSDPRPELEVRHLKGAATLLVVHAQGAFEGPARSSLKNLTTFVDELGLRRCQTRMAMADLPVEATAPILLPKGHVITTLIVRDCHEREYHAGVRQTLTVLRSRYCVIQGKREVSKVINRCGQCRRVTGGSFRAPEFPALPDFRVNPAPPFDKVGIDYFRPLLVKVENSSDYKKTWAALFTCCVTRAVHLELVADLSADQFLLAFRRLVALYRKPSLIVSDNATLFKATDAAFRKAAKSWSDGDGIVWKFIVESAPWMGGFYERLVGTVKSALRKTLGQKRLTADQLFTMLLEIAAIVNSRPLVPSLDATEPGELALTPAHFLRQSPGAALPNFEDADEFSNRVPKPTSESLLESWKCGQRILDEYWRSWRNDYLNALKELQTFRFRQRNCSSTEPAVGTVVQVRDDGPRCHWRLGVIQNVRASSDQKCRAADLRLASGRVICRPIRLLYPIEQSLIDSDCRGAPADQSQEGADPPVSAPGEGQEAEIPGTRESVGGPGQDAEIPGTRESAGGSTPVGPQRRSYRRTAALTARDRTLAGMMTFESDDE